MALDFPNSPTTGQTYTGPNSQVWSYDGVKWIPAGTPLYDGFANKFYNSSFQVAQRGSGPNNVTGTNTAPVYSLDGWKTGCQTATPTWQQILNGNFRGTALRIASPASPALTNFILMQRIEQLNASQLFGPNLQLQAVTVQIKIYNATNAAITPVLTIYAPTAADNWASATTVLAGTTLSSIPANSSTICTYTFMLTSAALLGLQVQWTFATIAASGYIDFAEADIRATPGAIVGVNSNPPTPELVDVGIEHRRCTRYYQTFTTHTRCYQSGNPGGNWYTWTFMPMRVSPSLSWGTTGGSNYSTFSPTVTGTCTVQLALYNSSTGSLNIYGSYNVNLTAEL